MKDHSSKHIVNCARCKQTSTEAGTIEAFTMKGSYVWQLCHPCITSSIAFITKGETMQGSDDPHFGVLALLIDDIDIAEHHDTCECEECIIDGDGHRKFLLENDHHFFQQIYKSA